MQSVDNVKQNGLSPNDVESCWLNDCDLDNLLHDGKFSNVLVIFASSGFGQYDQEELSNTIPFVLAKMGIIDPTSERAILSIANLDAVEYPDASGASLLELSVIASKLSWQQQPGECPVAYDETSTLPARLSSDCMIFSGTTLSGSMKSSAFIDYSPSKMPKRIRSVIQSKNSIYYANASKTKLKQTLCTFITKPFAARIIPNKIDNLMDFLSFGLEHRINPGGYEKIINNISIAETSGSPFIERGDEHLVYMLDRTHFNEIGLSNDAEKAIRAHEAFNKRLNDLITIWRTMIADTFSVTVELYDEALDDMHSEELLAVRDMLAVEPLVKALYNGVSVTDLLSQRG